MDITFLLWSVPFFCFSVFHIVVCAMEKNAVADASKKFLMPILLLTVWAFVGFNLHITVFNTIIILLSAGIIFGWLGDVFLIEPKKEKNFIFGTLSFFIGHVFYIIILCLLFQFLPIPTWLTVSVAIAYLLIIIATWIMNKKPKGIIGVGVILYAVLLVAFNSLALFLIIGYSSAGIPPSIITIFIGSTLFLISDAVLSRTIFIGEFPYHRVIVMSTYLAAEFLIAWGICCTL